MAKIRQVNVQPLIKFYISIIGLTFQKSAPNVTTLDLTLSYAGILSQTNLIFPNVSNLIIDLKLQRQDWNCIVLQDLIRTIGSMKKLKYLQIYLFCTNDNDWKLMNKEVEKRINYLKVGMKAMHEKLSAKMYAEINAFKNYDDFKTKNRNNVLTLVKKEKFMIPKIFEDQLE